jgi:hypothetical protein
MRNIFLLPGQKGSHCHGAADRKGNGDEGNINHNTGIPQSICKQWNQKQTRGKYASHRHGCEKGLLVSGSGNGRGNE